MNEIPEAVATQVPALYVLSGALVTVVGLFAGLILRGFSYLRARDAEARILQAHCHQNTDRLHESVVGMANESNAVHRDTSLVMGKNTQVTEAMLTYLQKQNGR